MAPENNDTAASSHPARKITRHDLAAHVSLSLRTVDELTRKGVLPFFKIGKSIRYDLAEVEAALRERYHVRAKKRKTTVSTARPLTA
jgi:excisionase family DNA binding protein